MRIMGGGGKAAGTGEKLEQTRRTPLVQARRFLPGAYPMQKFETVSEMRSVAAQFRRTGRTVALVPTSGALHAGHAALIALAKSKAGAVVVVGFPNPLAFGPSENFARYPRCPD